MNRAWLVMLALLVLPATAACGGNNGRETVAVYAASSLTDAFGELAGAFATANPGYEVALNFASSSELAVQINEGAPADVFASANRPQLDLVVAAGNASGVNDGAAAMIIASEAAARRHGLTPRARILGGAVAGVPPRIMGIGPAPATNKLLERLSLTVADLDVVELNEAFAAQGLAVLRQLMIADDDPRVNPNGGAIALGHPLGMSGARLAMTATEELQRNGRRYGLVTMCIGVGQGIALALERE